eukprot:130892-Chlamydomonas_euryale.AAC.5
MPAATLSHMSRQRCYVRHTTQHLNASACCVMMLCASRRCSTRSGFRLASLSASCSRCWGRSTWRASRHARRETASRGRGRVS